VYRKSVLEEDLELTNKQYDSTIIAAFNIVELSGDIGRALECLSDLITDEKTKMQFVKRVKDYYAKQELGVRN